MKKFVVIYHAPPSLMEQTANTPQEEKEKSMQAWMEWAKKCGDKLVDLGQPLGNGQALKAGGNGQPSKHDVAGYSVLQAESMEEAKKLLQDHPHLQWDGSCSIEVHEAMPIPGM